MACSDSKGVSAVKAVPWTTQNWKTLKRKARKALRLGRLRVHDAFRSSYASPVQNQIGDQVEALHRFFTPPVLEPSREDLLATELFQKHYFDLLGSGWCQVTYGMTCRGFDGVRYPAQLSSATDPGLREGLVRRLPRASRDYAGHLRTMISSKYEPIDWHIDIKSGYRWQEDIWYRDVKYGHLDGVDIKVPWELSRSHHLVEMAMVYTHTREEALAREFQDQVLDWMASNPPRYSVNWICTMDVAIRIANWLVAYDLFRASEALFSEEFNHVFVAAVWQHGEHIINNLEWSEAKRANHYLANICGLLVAAAYLPAAPLSNAWLLFAIHELEMETARQFLADGGHFESSTSYHNLCAEMVVVSTAFVPALPRDRVEKLLFAAHAKIPFPPGIGITEYTSQTLKERFRNTGRLLSDDLLRRLHAAARLTKLLMRSDGSVPQLGDNDSGRFMRYGGWISAGTVADVRTRFCNLAGYEGLDDRAVYLMQPPSTDSHWLAWLGADNAADEPVPVRARDSGSRNAQCLVQSMPIPRSECAGGLVRTQNDSEPLALVANPMPHLGGGPPSFVVSEKTAAVAGYLWTNMRRYAFPASGLYLVRSDRVHVLIRCGNALVDGSGAHAHDDQLSISLTVDGEELVFDPGSYVYTPAVSRRYRYRSASAHAAPCTWKDSGMDNSMYSSCFCSPHHPVGQCLRFSDKEFLGTTTVDGGYVLRSVLFCHQHIEVVDSYYLKEGWRPAQTRPLSPALPVLLSPEYGWITC